MPAHELANKLLEGPDLPVTLPDGYDQCYLREAEYIEERKAGQNNFETDSWKEDHIHLS